MPKVVLPSVRDTDNDNLKMQYLTDSYVRLKKELTFLLGNLDEDNVIRAQSVIAEWVYAGNVKTDQLVAGEAKIDTALIEDLIVGGNVTMGPNATISWDKVTSQPTIPVLPSYIKSTYISSTEIRSPTIIGGEVIGGTVTAGTNSKVKILDYSGGGSVEFLTSSNTHAGVLYHNDSADEIVLETPSGESINIRSSKYLEFDSQLGTNFDGDVDFNGDVTIGSSSSYVGFFGDSGASQQTASLLLPSETLSDVIITVNGLITKLGRYGLFDVS